MIGSKMFTHLRDAVGRLDPNEVRESASIPVSLQLIASGDDAYREMERYFLPSSLSDARRSEAQQVIFRAGSNAPGPVVLKVVEDGLPRDAASFAFYRHKPELAVEDILRRRPELHLALARRICPFREPVVNDVIRTVSRENALFSIATAVPSIVPFISLPWAVGEFASDTAFLTMNQIRMAFMLAAASDRTIGYREQKGEVASMFAGAFGWRAIARELIGKIPYGGGLIPKAAVAYAGTYVVGLSLERLYRLGYGFTEQERKAAYEAAYEKGKSVAATLMKTYGSRKAS